MAYEEVVDRFLKKLSRVYQVSLVASLQDETLGEAGLAAVITQ